jgi:hypothetical protein
MFDVAPERLSDIEVVHIGLAEYVIYGLQEVLGDRDVLWCILLPHLDTLLKADA